MTCAKAPSHPGAQCNYRSVSRVTLGSRSRGSLASAVSAVVELAACPLRRRLVMSGAGPLAIVICALAIACAPGHVGLLMATAGTAIDQGPYRAEP